MLCKLVKYLSRSFCLSSPVNIYTCATDSNVLLKEGLDSWLQLPLNNSHYYYRDEATLGIQNAPKIMLKFSWAMASIFDGTFSKFWEFFSLSFSGNSFVQLGRISIPGHSNLALPGGDRRQKFIVGSIAIAQGQQEDE